VYGFPKSSRDNITAAELADLRDLAKVILSYDEKELAASVAAGIWKEVNCNGYDIQE
jgi:hypothetical protein